MPGTFLDYPFDDEIFVRAWHDQPDPVRLALISSGVMVEDPRITQALAGDGNLFTVPFYLPLGAGGESKAYSAGAATATGPANYDGKTDIPLTETAGSHYSGVAYGRTQGFFERDFIPELTGSDPMGLIVRKIADFWNRNRQARLMGVLKAAIENPDDPDTDADTSWVGTHTKTIVKPAILENLPARVNTALTEIFGVHKENIRVLLMDSLTASDFENLNLLKYRRGVDADAMLRSPRIGELMGYTVVVDDTAMAGTSGYIYALGEGALLTGRPRLDRPAELMRDGIRFGGVTALLTRIRDVIHPNGFSFAQSTASISGDGGAWAGSPLDAVLHNKTNYSIVYPYPMINMALLKIVAPGAGEGGDDSLHVYLSGMHEDLTLPVEIVNKDEIDVKVTNPNDFDFTVEP